MYDKCVEFASNKGVKVENHSQALELLDKARAQVNYITMTKEQKVEKAQRCPLF